MDRLLQKIYEDVIREEREADAMEKRVNAYIAGLAEPYAEKLGDGEMEALKNLLYAAALRGEEEGFWLGVRMAVKTAQKLSDKEQG